jgi:hypothetical protein
VAISRFTSTQLVLPRVTSCLIGEHTSAVSELTAIAADKDIIVSQVKWPALTDNDKVGAGWITATRSGHVKQISSRPKTRRRASTEGGRLTDMGAPESSRADPMTKAVATGAHSSD